MGYPVHVRIRKRNTTACGAPFLLYKSNEEPVAYCTAYEATVNGEAFAKSLKPNGDEKGNDTAMNTLSLTCHLYDDWGCSEIKLKK